MFAVIRTGGKQFCVAENDRIVVERLSGRPGDVIELGDVLMLSEDGEPPLIGADQLDKVKVFAEVMAQRRGEKILVFKKKRRKNYRRMRGHRQHQTVLRIARISPTGEKPELAASAEMAPAPAPQAAPLGPVDEVAAAVAETESKE